MLKFMRVVPCAKLSNLLNNMFSNRFFQVIFGDKSSRWRRLNNGSVLAPLMFSLYLSDILSTLSNQFQDFEANLEIDLERLNHYFHRW
jgi:hypothetical protein